MLASRLAAGSAIDLISTWCPSWLGAHAVKKADEQDGPIPVVETPQMDFWTGTTGSASEKDAEGAEQVALETVSHHDGSTGMVALRSHGPQVPPAQ